MPSVSAQTSSLRSGSHSSASRQLRRSNTERSSTPSTATPLPPRAIGVSLGAPSRSADRGGIALVAVEQRDDADHGRQAGQQRVQPVSVDRVDHQRPGADHDRA